MVGQDTYAVVTCPYCFEQVDLFVDPDSEGQMIEDCAVCCRPWQVWVARRGGVLDVTVSRAQ